MIKKYCIICGKELPEKRIKQGKDTCCHSCAARKRFSNPEQREQLSQSVKAAYKNNPEVKQNLAKAMEKIYSNRAIQEKRIASIKATMSTEEYHNKRSEIAKNLWNDDNYRAKTVATMKDHFSKEDYRQKQSKAQKIAQNRPEVKQKHSEDLSRRLREKYKNPEEQEKASRLQKILQNNPKTNSKRSASLIATFSNPEVRLKIYNTKKKNGTLTTSKPEQCIKSLLENAFKEVHYQYRCDKYPFNCDFYIKDLDTFIEYNGTWTHGGAPYDENEQWCIDKLKQWKEKAKTSNYYQSAIATWTYKDVKKLKTFIENGLNYKVFYNYNQFIDWYNKELR